MARLDRVATAVAALLIALFGLLPIANWIPGGPSIPSWPDLLDGWWSGTVVVAGGALVLTLLSRRVAWRVPLFPLLLRAWSTRPLLVTAALTIAAFSVYLWTAWSVFSGKPLLVDEIAQVYQARLFAEGSLARDAVPYPEFFSSNLLLERGGRLFSQFPAGGPAMLAVGTLLGGEWLTGPLFGAISVALFAGILRRVEPRPGVALGALTVFAFAPFTVFMSGSHMNHVTVLTWLLVACTGVIRWVDGDVPRLRWAVLAGLGFGVAATIRPLDAAAFAVPAGIWLLVRSVRRGEGLPVLACGAAAAAIVAVQLWVNARTTGAPLLFGYNANYGSGQELGFHRTPWGDVHTPARGLELLNLYFVRLQSFFLELPVPSLLPATAALALTRRLSPVDRYLLAAGGALCGLYFTYWHDGFYLGPRFTYPMLPVLALWTARVFPLVLHQVRWALAGRALAIGAVLAVGMGLATSLPIRIREHRTRFTTMRWDADAAAKAAGIGRALVFVRESWGAQLISRMWAAGLAAGRTEQVYRRVDACLLEQGIDTIERRGLRGAAAEAVLLPLLADSTRVVPSPFTVDKTTRYLQGVSYTAECRQRLEDDQRGFTIFAPLVLAGRADVVYARDLHARDSLLTDTYHDHDVYLLRPASSDLGALPQFERLDRDSLMGAWRNAP